MREASSTRSPYSSFMHFSWPGATGQATKASFPCLNHHDLAQRKENYNRHARHTDRLRSSPHHQLGSASAGPGGYFVKKFHRHFLFVLLSLSRISRSIGSCGNDAEGIGSPCNIWLERWLILDPLQGVCECDTS